jgi:hypothetical protein
MNSMTSRDSTGVNRPRRMRFWLRLLLLAATTVPPASGLGQESPPRVDLPASLWFGMSSAVVRQRLEEQGAKLGKLKANEDRFKGGTNAKTDDVMILNRRARSGGAWFQRDSLVGLELTFSVGGDYAISSWVDSVRAALERKYGPPVVSNFRFGGALAMPPHGDNEAVWSIADSEIRLAVRAENPVGAIINKSAGRYAGSVRLAYGIPPYRKGLVAPEQGP